MTTITLTITVAQDDIIGGLGIEPSDAEQALFEYVEHALTADWHTAPDVGDITIKVQS